MRLVESMGVRTISEKPYLRICQTHQQNLELGSQTLEDSTAAIVTIPLACRLPIWCMCQRNSHGTSNNSKNFMPAWPMLLTWSTQIAINQYVCLFVFLSLPSICLSIYLGSVLPFVPLSSITPHFCSLNLTLQSDSMAATAGSLFYFCKDSLSLISYFSLAIWIKHHDQR